MPHHIPTRRAVLAGSAAALGGLAATGRTARAGTTADDGFSYEITRTDAEWRERLSDFEYYVLREGGTELRRQSPLWEETRAGSYACRGCDLTLYESPWKQVLDIGWVFFHQSCPNAILMDIDGEAPDEMAEMMPDPSQAVIEAHCRRCGSHLGHILYVPPGEAALHCINGTALVFTATET